MSLKLGSISLLKFPGSLLAPSPSPSPSPRRTNNTNLYLDLLVLFIICTLVAVLCFLLSRKRNRNHNHNHNHNPDRDVNDSDLEVGLRQGLGDEALEQLMPCVNYSDQEMTPSSNYCVICLENFVDGESCRLFPVCYHIFHSVCIDQWLKEHLTCPVCRISCIDMENY